MAVFRLLHASDLHFSRTPYQVGIPESLGHLMAGWPGGHLHTVSSQSPPVAREFARCAFKLGQLIDAIVLTGDLATTGDGRDLQAAYDFIAAPAVTTSHLTTQGTPTLQGAGRDVILLPGNHDRFEALFPYAPGEMNFDATFGSFWGAKQGVQRLWEGLREGAWLVLIGVDFTLEDGDNGDAPVVGHLGQGRCYDARVQALKTETQRARAEHPGCCVLWLMHFHPVKPGLLALLDRDVLEGALREVEVNGILCGHTHQFETGVTLAGCPVFVIGSATQYSLAGNDLQLIEVDVSTTPGAGHHVTVKRLLYDSNRGFVGQP